MKVCPNCPKVALKVVHDPLGTFEACSQCNYCKQVGPPMQKAKTEVLGTAIRQIPVHSLQEIGRIFEEGAAKYGRDNWKKGVNDKEYQEERLEHAITHLLRYANGDTSENHLAKVAWYCVTQLEHTRLEIAENS